MRMKEPTTQKQCTAADPTAVHVMFGFRAEAGPNQKCEQEALASRYGCSGMQLSCNLHYFGPIVLQAWQ